MDKVLPLDANGNPVPIFEMPTTASTIKVDGTSASAASTNVIDATRNRICWIVADAACYVLAGSAPTALNNGTCMKLAAGVHTLLVPANTKVACIGSIIYITPQP